MNPKTKKIVLLLYIVFGSVLVGMLIHEIIHLFQGSAYAICYVIGKGMPFIVKPQDPSVVSLSGEIIAYFIEFIVIVGLTTIGIKMLNKK